jgi:nicotinic acid mononucleotide adenylyltransferase
VAHVALAAASRAHVDEVLYVVPQTFPHKEYFGATLEQRIELLESLESPIPRSIASTEQGLLIDIAAECRMEFGAATQLYFLCGRDAAERVLTWDYGRAGVVDEMLNQFQLLVASRKGDFVAPSEFQHRVHPLAIEAGHDQVSSTEVRERIRRGEPWDRLVPESIVERVRQIYS